MEAGGSVKGLSYKDLLAERLPREVVSRLPRSFDVIGDIALIKLPEDLKPYGREISEAIAKIHARVRAVYSRGPAEGTLRIPRLHHLWGEERTETVYRENGLRLSVDISKMYVNPRLGSERLRVASEILDGELVLDVFSSYGAFALNIARLRASTVVAIDINTAALEHMARSVRMNKLRGEAHPLVSDALEPPLIGRKFTTVISDNPTNALDAVSKISDLLRKGGRAYIYALTEDPEIFRARISEASGNALIVVEVRRVKEYSPSLSIHVFKCIKIS